MLIESVNKENKENNVQSQINQPPSTQPTMNAAGLTSTVPKFRISAGHPATHRYNGNIRQTRIVAWYDMSMQVNVNFK